MDVQRADGNKEVLPKLRNRASNSVIAMEGTMVPQRHTVSERQRDDRESLGRTEA